MNQNLRVVTHYCGLAVSRSRDSWSRDLVVRDLAISRSCSLAQYCSASFSLAISRSVIVATDDQLSASVFLTTPTMRGL